MLRMHSFPLPYSVFRSRLPHVRLCPFRARSWAVGYRGEGDGGACGDGVAGPGRRLRGGGARHDGAQHRRRCGLAPQGEVPEVPDHVGLADLLRVHVHLASKHGEDRGHVRPALCDVLGTQEADFQEPAGFIDIKVVAQITVYDLVQVPLVIVCPSLLKKNLIFIRQSCISVAPSTDYFYKQNTKAVNI